MSQGDIKQFWDVDSATQVGSCKLCPELVMYRWYRPVFMVSGSSIGIGYI